MIKVTAIEPSKRNKDWSIVTFSNLEDKYVKQAAELRGYVYTTKSAKESYLSNKVNLEIGEVFDGEEVITKSSKNPFFEGQKIRKNGLYYNNIIVYVTPFKNQALEFIEEFSKLLLPNKQAILNYNFPINIDTFLPRLEHLICPFEFLGLKFNLIQDYTVLYPYATEYQNLYSEQSVCLLIGLNAEPIIKYLIALTGMKIFINYNFKIFINYSTRSLNVENVCDENKESFYFAFNLYENKSYYNISSPISPYDFLKHGFTDLTSEEIIKRYPNINPNESSILEEEYDDIFHWSQRDINREHYEADKDAFDALTDGQYGDFYPYEEY